MQNEQNPDVNTPQPYDSDGESEGPPRDSGRTDVERPDPTVPVPPDSEPTAPVREPPESGGPPVGEADDSPKRIA